MRALDTDYLVIGAGAAGMAFTDALVTDSQADVVMVDRRHAPGGHWHDAYPFVRLHQPAAFYGVNSMRLGSDRIDEVGPNAGLYELATSGQICAYFEKVLGQLAADGQVRFFGMSNYLGEDDGGHIFASLLTGETTSVRVRRKVVDATFLETAVPSTHAPSFEVDPGARFIAINDLVNLAEAGSGYTIIGGGKTAIDACLWLLDNGVSPDSIRWLRPRDTWLLDRRLQQPLSMVPRLMEGVSLYLEAAAEAESVADLFRRLEDCGHLVRVDQSFEPSMFRCATVSDSELEALRSIENVVRAGHVLRVGDDRIVMENGSVPTDGHQVHVDCSARGLRVTEPRRVFEPDRVTTQQVRACQPMISHALAGYVEATRSEDVEAANRLCPPNPYPSAATDWIPLTVTAQRAQLSWSEPDVADWMEQSRLNAARGISDHMDDPLMQLATARYLQSIEPAIANLSRLATTLPRGSPSGHD